MNGHRTSVLPGGGYSCRNTGGCSGSCRSCRSRSLHSPIFQKNTILVLRQVLYSCGWVWSAGITFGSSSGASRFDARAAAGDLAVNTSVAPADCRDIAQAVLRTITARLNRLLESLPGCPALATDKRGLGRVISPEFIRTTANSSRKAEHPSVETSRLDVLCLRTDVSMVRVCAKLLDGRQVASLY